MAHLVPIRGQARLACLPALQTYVRECSDFSGSFLGPCGVKGFSAAVASLMGAHLGSERPSPLSVGVGEQGHHPHSAAGLPIPHAPTPLRACRKQQQQGALATNLVPAMEATMVIASVTSTGSKYM